MTEYCAASFLALGVRRSTWLGCTFVFRFARRSAYIASRALHGENNGADGSTTPPSARNSSSTPRPLGPIMMVRHFPRCCDLCRAGRYVPCSEVRSISMSRIRHTSPGRMPVSCWSRIIVRTWRLRKARVAATITGSAGFTGTDSGAEYRPALSGLKAARAWYTPPVTSSRSVPHRKIRRKRSTCWFTVRRLHPKEINRSRVASRVSGPNSSAGRLPYSSRTGLDTSFTSAISFVEVPSGRR